MTIIQNELLNMLREVSDFLEKHNFEYYIFYGTLLGAVRHKGFIPWDDDIDLVMKRDEYDRLVNFLLNNNRINSHLVFSSYEIDGYKKPYIKVLNKNIKVIDKSGIDDYLWIDIFPLDNISDNDQFNYNYNKKIYFYVKLYFWKLQRIDRSENVFKFITHFLLKIILKFVSIDYIIRKIIDLSKNFPNKSDDYLNNCVWSTNFSCKLNKNWFVPDRITFENIELVGCKYYDKVLKELYGDYMKLPPENKRINHDYKIEYIK